MDPARLRKWLSIGAWAVIGLIVVVVAAATWLYTNDLRRTFLSPTGEPPERTLEVLGVGSGRVVLSYSELAALDGVWGLRGEGEDYGQVSSVLDVGETQVERSFLELVGEFFPGEAVALDQYAFAGDPEEAHGIPFEEVQVAGDLGFYPAWFIDGDKDTWVVFIHGMGADERRQSLRVLPSIVDEDFPVLVMTYRNDDGAPETDDGLYTWGRSEWRDVEAAIEFGTSRGAEEFVLIGYSMGGTIASMFLHESDLVGDVRGVVLDSPVLSLEEVIDRHAEASRLPGVLKAIGKAVARVRFGLEWSELDQVERSSQFDVPILLMHGGSDTMAPIEVSELFATARSDLVSFERFDAADHLFLWNTDPTRYEEAVLRFLGEVTQIDQS